MAIDLAWGPSGLERLRRGSEVLVIVDVLRFTSAVTVAVARGARVVPAAGLPPGPEQLSPVALGLLAASREVALRSPNGGALAALALEARLPVVAASFLNASAVARALAGRQAGFVAAGERGWSGLRLALEDFLGAGAVIDRLPGERSRAADAAAAAFRAAGPLAEALPNCISGRELVERGRAADVAAAARLDAYDAVPVLRGGQFVNGHVD
jgi:2-phosphosulfolactate phosphatase